MLAASESRMVSSPCPGPQHYLESMLAASESRVVSFTWLWRLWPSQQRILCRSQRYSTIFFTELEARHQNNIFIDDISDIVEKHTASTFDPYVKYCTNEVYQQRTLQKLLATNPSFKEVLSRIESHEDCRNLPMISFLILPMQRVTRLPLLMDTICQKTPKDSPKYEACKRALKEVSKLVRLCNEGARKMERTEMMYTINSQLEFKIKPFPLVSSSRWLLKRGELTAFVEDTVLFSRRTSRQQVYFFLFNDVLIITKKKSWFFVEKPQMPSALGSSSHQRDPPVFPSAGPHSVYPSACSEGCAHCPWPLAQWTAAGGLQTCGLAVSSAGHRLLWVGRPLHLVEITASPGMQPGGAAASREPRSDNERKPGAEESYNVNDYSLRDQLSVECCDSEELASSPGRSGSAVLHSRQSAACHLFTLTVLSNHANEKVEMLLGAETQSERARWITALGHSSGKQPPDRTSLTQVEIIRSFTAKQPDELSLQVGDVALIYQRVGDGWYEGERLRDGERGWFPMECAKEITCQTTIDENVERMGRLLGLETNV
ncbi:Rho guanine nucleotide exchange factor 26 [Sciurus carolinensis]|uniref:Rho guanine nucleotide exchange factor 26 n=1 Tax=Sciurus carolinensis TaxID=30640 RepID=A0AA41SYM2_SCICA|nr:Rho guanine nucleotide exchange factor 26 [Sciurus carolinensis]